MSDKYSGVNKNGQYELVITNLKATFFDVILREDGILGKLEKQLEIEVDEEKKKELQMVINKKTEALNNTMKLVNELVAQVEGLDVITKSLTVLEDKKVVLIEDSSDKKIEKEYKKDLENGLQVQQRLEDSVHEVEKENMTDKVEARVVNDEVELNDDVVKAPSEPDISEVTEEKSSVGNEIKEIIPDKIDTEVSVDENNVQSVSDIEPLFNNVSKEILGSGAVSTPIVIESGSKDYEKVPEIKVEPIVITVDEKKDEVAPDVNPIVVPSFNDDVVKAEIEPIVTEVEKDVVPESVVSPVSVQEEKIIEEKNVPATEPDGLVGKTEDNNVKEENHGMPRLIRTTGDTIKAILVTENQGNKLEESLNTQKSLLSIKDILNGNEVTVKSMIDGNDKSLEQSVTEESIESMLEQANLLYKDGKIAEAKQMYDKISVLNQALQKGDLANSGVAFVKA